MVNKMKKIILEYDKNDPDIKLRTFYCSVCGKPYKDDAEQAYNPKYTPACSEKCWEVVYDKEESERVRAEYCAFMCEEDVEKSSDTVERFEVTITSDAFPDIDDSFAIWDNKYNDYYTLGDGTIPTFRFESDAEDCCKTIKDYLKNKAVDWYCPDCRNILKYDKDGILYCPDCDKE